MTAAERSTPRRVALSRGRGSKLGVGDHLLEHTLSPSHGGADRNSEIALPAIAHSCRPLTGARIETRSARGRSPPSGVALSRGRGSKLHVLRRILPFIGSPSHGGADRNVENGRDICHKVSVALSRGRGSKPRLRPHASRPSVALSRGRGSKRPHGDRGTDVDRGCPLTGARIETSSYTTNTQTTVSPSHGGADRNAYGGGGATCKACRPLTGARIET